MIRPKCHPSRLHKAKGKCGPCYDRNRARLGLRAEEHRRRQMRLYGLTVADYEALLLRQGGVCAICKQPPGKTRLAVDHDHETGEVRGLLCFNCNLGLGKFQDDPRLLIVALRYLTNE